MVVVALLLEKLDGIGDDDRVRTYIPRQSLKNLRVKTHIYAKG